MLVLSRTPEETIVIGDVTIKVLQIVGNTVRIGIEAPKEVVILRGEVKDRDTATGS